MGISKRQEGDSLQLMGCHSGEGVEEHGAGGFIEWVSFCLNEDLGSADCGLELCGATPPKCCKCVG